VARIMPLQHPVRMSSNQTLRTAPLRVLFVSPGVLVGSHLVFVRREAEALRAAGHEVDVFGFDNESYRLWHLAKQVMKLRREIRRLRPDVVHAQFGKFNALVSALALFFSFKKKNPPLVITFRGTDINRNTRYSWLRSALGLAASQLAAFAARGLVCVSSEIRSKVLAHRTRACIVVPTGVDLRTFVPLDFQAARARLGFGANEKIVLFNAGRNPAVKDPELAAAAVAEAQKHAGAIRFVVLNGNVTPDEIPVYMNAADCLLVTSRTEGSPTVVQEAMACNLPVVSVDVGDVRERLAGVTHCAVLPSRDPAALGAAVAALLRKPDRSDGRRHAAALSVEAIAARLTDFYGTLLGRSLHSHFSAKYRAAG
jgi:teichuronic acid biosynthesis glycosyltransferase TuaC